MDGGKGGLRGCIAGCLKLPREHTDCKPVSYVCCCAVRGHVHASLGRASLPPSPPTHSHRPYRHFLPTPPALSHECNPLPTLPHLPPPSSPPSQRLLALFGGFPPEVRAMLRNSRPSGVVEAGVWVRRAAELPAALGRGRVLILGEAAHPMRPSSQEENQVRACGCGSVWRRVGGLLHSQGFRCDLWPQRTHKCTHSQYYARTHAHTHTHTHTHTHKHTHMHTRTGPGGRGCAGRVCTAARPQQGGAEALRGGAQAAVEARHAGGAGWAGGEAGKGGQWWCFRGLRSKGRQATWVSLGEGSTARKPHQRHGGRWISGNFRRSGSVSVRATCAQ